ncbi:MAG: glutamine synthetase beta-grasp domain-containing protein, partial [Elusimicrobia bacterium]|nr:glutamine synthetase beta-grasp domain-containing protein [Elusimicrobiota bacterium]
MPTTLDTTRRTRAAKNADTRDSETRSAVKDLFKLAQEKGVKLADLRFTDLLGTQQHVTLHIDQLEPVTFDRGVGFDGSSIRGFQAIHESDMLLMPDPETAFVDPMLDTPTLALTCNIADPITKAPYGRDARGVAQRAERFLKDSKVATHSLWGPEAEFFVFDSVRFDLRTEGSFYEIDAEEGIWNSGRNGSPNLAYRPRFKEGYFP